MGMVVKDLFKISIFSDAKLVAGKQGLNNEIIWFNLMEILDVVDSLEYGEFLITTGFRLDQYEFSKNLIYKLKEKGVAGIGIQLGYYIDSIPKHLLEVGNEINFPIINIPSKITFSMITRTMYKELLAYEQNDRLKNTKVYGSSVILDVLESKVLSIESANYLHSILREDDGYESYMMNFDIGHKHDGIIMRSDIEKSLDCIISSLKKCDCNVHTEVINGSSIIILSKPSNINFINIYNQLEQAINGLYNCYENLVFKLAISKKIESIDQVNKAYYETLAIQKQLSSIEVSKGVIRSEDVDMLRLFSGKENREELVKFATEVLQPIKKYDEENQSEYLETLKIYIYNNCNVSITSKQLYIHRHTLTYRLDKLNSLFEIDFMNYRSILKYKFAIFIKLLY